ncbi:unnamed protein product [Ilex paraguariensis]|uniref:SMP domain-containing protein n=1 Tax=Ilex paraguariensis TaxID=185542 RepID=A0ABC8S9I4_9AQUA
MSQQQQPRRPQGVEEPIRYGDVFNVSSDLSSTTIAPQEVATMQSAENIALGETTKGGPASVMQSAAAANEKTGLVGHDDVTNMAVDQGVTVAEAEVVGYRIVTEAVGGQVVGQYVDAGPVLGMTSPASAPGRDAITVGEALEATALAAGDKPVDQGDASAIQAAEARATGLGQVTPGGVGAAAQSAASFNAQLIFDENKTKLADVLADATTRLPDDKPVTREDAQGVIAAEIRKKPDMATHPGGVAGSMAAAARLNQEK